MSTCPTPQRDRFATREAAALALPRKWIRTGCFLRPYWCGCGWWHLTKWTPKRQQRTKPRRKRVRR